MQNIDVQLNTNRASLVQYLCAQGNPKRSCIKWQTLLSVQIPTNHQVVNQIKQNYPGPLLRETVYVQQNKH